MKIEKEVKMKINNETDKKKLVKVKNWISGWIFILPAALILYFFTIRPQFLGFVWSFFRMQGFKIVKFVGFDNYFRVITDTMFLKNLWNTFQYVFWSLVIGYPLPIILAVLLNEAVHLRKSLRLMVYFPSILPAIGTSLLWTFIFSPTSGGFLNTVLQVFGLEPYVWLQDSQWTILYIIISMTWSGCGATVLYYFAALQGVNRELYEAAIIDGAGFFKRLRVVALPHISTISLLFLVKQIIGIFSIRDQPMQMTDGGPNGASMTLGLQIYRYGFVDFRPDLAMALGVIMFVMLMIITIFYFRLERKMTE